MFYHLKHAIRFIQRNLSYALISVGALAISLTLIVLLSVYLHTEKNVDTQHYQADQLFRVVRSGECAFSPPFGQYLVDNVDEIIEYCRTFVLDGVLKTENVIVRSDHCFYADSNFFTLFNLPLIVGHPNEVLASRENVVLSESYAHVLFPNDEPLGKKVIFNNRLEYTVVGIAADFDEHTHFNGVDIILPFGAMEDFLGTNSNYLKQFDWRWLLPALYIKSSSKQLNQIEQSVLADVKQWYWLFKEDANASLSFQSINEAYLNPVNYGYPISARTGNANVLNLTVFIILAVCFIAFVNFINLSISKSNSRLMEIEVKRINGAGWMHFTGSSFMEQVLIAGSTFVLFLFLLSLSLPFYNQLLQYNQSTTSILSQSFIVQLVIAFLALSCFTGVSVFVVSIVVQLKSNLKLKKSTQPIGFLQRFLVITQYGMSVVLITLMLFVIKQKHFIANYDLGFNKNETLFIRLNREFIGKAALFKEELKKIGGVKSVSLCNGMPGVGIMDLRFELDGNVKSIDWFNMDEDYFEAMGFQIGTDSHLEEGSCWINESAARALNYDKGIGMVNVIGMGEELKYNVVGVLPNMNFHSLYKRARPTIFTAANTDRFIDYVLLNVNTNRMESIIAQAKVAYEKISTSFPFDYYFINDKLNEAYKKETRTLKLIGVFAIFGIILSSIGMLSLAIIMVQNKTKEIGVRKVNGARVIEIVSMFNSRFVFWVCIAFAFATPIAYSLLQRWLQNFAYKTEISWWVFALSGLFALAIAMFTVSWQTIRAARRNPIEALRYE